jgi:hypothetical protein
MRTLTAICYALLALPLLAALVPVQLILSGLAWAVDKATGFIIDTGIRLSGKKPNARGWRSILN